MEAALHCHASGCSPPGRERLSGGGGRGGGGGGGARPHGGLGHLADGGVGQLEAHVLALPLGPAPLGKLAEVGLQAVALGHAAGCHALPLAGRVQQPLVALGGRETHRRLDTGM